MLFGLLRRLVSGEVNVRNNRFIGDYVGLISRPPPPPRPIRDIAITGLFANHVEVVTGQNITIEAVVVNFGDLHENFNLTIFYNSSPSSSHVEEKG